jgi:hypothetical protein
MTFWHHRWSQQHQHRARSHVCSYNGGTTGTDAVWSGVPVLTLPLNKFAARLVAAVSRYLFIMIHNGWHVQVRRQPQHRHRFAAGCCSKLGRFCCVRTKVREAPDITGMCARCYPSNVEHAVTLCKRYACNRAHAQKLKHMVKSEVRRRLF